MPRPFIQVHHAHIPHYPAARYGQFGYMDPNAPVCPRVNNPRPHFPHPQSYASLPPLPLDPETSSGSSSEESSDSEGGNSMEANHSSPSAQQLKKKFVLYIVVFTLYVKLLHKLDDSCKLLIPP